MKIEYHECECAEPGGVFAPVTKQACLALGHTHMQSWMHAKGPFLIMTPLPLLLHGSTPVLCNFIRSLLASKPGKQVARPPAPVRRQVLTMGENEIKWRPPKRKEESNKRGASRRWTEGCWGRKRWMEILSGVIWSILYLYMVQHFARSRIVKNLKTGLAACRPASAVGVE